MTSLSTASSMSSTRPLRQLQPKAGKRGSAIAGNHAVEGEYHGAGGHQAHVGVQDPRRFQETSERSSGPGLRERRLAVHVSMPWGLFFLSYVLQALQIRAVRLLQYSPSITAPSYYALTRSCLVRLFCKNSSSLGRDIFRSGISRRKDNLWSTRN